MNKRISKKRKAQTAPTHTIERIVSVRDFTVQEAWDKVIDYLITAHEDVCYFIDSVETGNKLNVHQAGERYAILTATKSADEIKNRVPVETEYPLWDHDIKPEEVTFYCKECGDEMNAQTDIANEGLCDPCNQGQKEMWAAEQKHEDYEYRNMKL